MSNISNIKSIAFQNGPVLKTSEVVAGLMKLGNILDKIEMGEEENKYYIDVIWNAIDMITIEKETIK
tara:strand:+ start:363 stop:563 length:201 start_codon:yes stop_codon:yes gene_type:complete